MSELADVLSGAESRTEAALPGFDTAVLARAVSARVRRGRALRAVRTGVVAVAVIGAIGVGGSTSAQDEQFAQAGIDTLQRR
jgi:uncharacterized protein GlcG (DUF336 family)